MITTIRSEIIIVLSLVMGAIKQILLIIKTNGINRTIRVDGSLCGFNVSILYNKKITEPYLIDIDKDVLHLNVERRWKERNQNN